MFKMRKKIRIRYILFGVKNKKWLHTNVSSVKRKYLVTTWIKDLFALFVEVKFSTNLGQQ